MMGWILWTRIYMHQGEYSILDSRLETFFVRNTILDLKE